MKKQRFLVWLASASLLVVMVVATQPQPSRADSHGDVMATQNPAIKYCLDNGGEGQL